MTTIHYNDNKDNNTAASGCTLVDVQEVSLGCECQCQYYIYICEDE